MQKIKDLRLLLDKFYITEEYRPNKIKMKLSSISWLYERSKWKENVIKYFNDVKPKKIYSKISNQLHKELYHKKVLIYGCGTIAYFIINEINIKTLMFVQD